MKKTSCDPITRGRTCHGAVRDAQHVMNNSHISSPGHLASFLSVWCAPTRVVECGHAVRCFVRHALLDGPTEWYTGYGVKKNNGCDDTQGANNDADHATGSRRTRPIKFTLAPCAKDNLSQTRPLLSVHPCRHRSAERDEQRRTCLFLRCACRQSSVSALL